jgi:UTP:GlnB (protein PII) uridylyltransferase
VISLDICAFLADVTGVLCELELTIKKVKVSTTPDGKVMDLFFITDTRFYILDTLSSDFHIFYFASRLLRAKM